MSIPNVPCTTSLGLSATNAPLELQEEDTLYLLLIVKSKILREEQFGAILFICATILSHFVDPNGISVSLTKLELVALSITTFFCAPGLLFAGISFLG
jgi:hypothetical protein